MRSGQRITSYHVMAGSCPAIHAVEPDRCRQGEATTLRPKPDTFPNHLSRCMAWMPGQMSGMTARMGVGQSQYVSA